MSNIPLLSSASGRGHRGESFFVLTRWMTVDERELAFDFERANREAFVGALVEVDRLGARCHW